MRHKGYVVLVVGLASLAGAIALVGWHYHRGSNAVFVPTWRVEYGKMPASDAALIDWLKSQPGVNEVSVHRDGKTLAITYEIKAGHPMPNVLDQADTLGYAERGSFSGDMRVK
jgi:hypothetical protein